MGVNFHPIPARIQGLEHYLECKPGEICRTGDFTVWKKMESTHIRCPVWVNTSSSAPSISPGQTNAVKNQEIHTLGGEGEELREKGRPGVGA